jgi:hypothetical protein
VATGKTDVFGIHVTVFIQNPSGVMVATLLVTILEVGARRELCKVQLHVPSKNRIDEKSGFVGTLKIGAFGGIVAIAVGAGAIAFGVVV